MDPFSVSTACVGLLAAVAQLSIQINTFVSQVRYARRDMEEVSRELSSLSLCLETLRDDSVRVKYPEESRQTLIAVIQNCDLITKEMTALLHRLSSGNLGKRIRWSLSGRDDISRLRSSLEAHKSAMQIALAMVAT